MVCLVGIVVLTYVGQRIIIPVNKKIRGGEYDGPAGLTTLLQPLDDLNNIRFVGSTDHLGRDRLVHRRPRATCWRRSHDTPVQGWSATGSGGVVRRSRALTVVRPGSASWSRPASSST